MNPTPALIVSAEQLEDLLIRAGKLAAEQAVNELRAELTQDPDRKNLLDLRSYLIDPDSIANPRQRWAGSKVIRQIELNGQGQPKSVAWFMKFQRETNLKACPSRRSPTYGRSREWTFEDIGHAWGVYYHPLKF